MRLAPNRPVRAKSGHGERVCPGRITDAVPMANAQTRLEQVLNGVIAAEIRANRQQSEPKQVRAVGS